MNILNVFFFVILPAVFSRSHSLHGAEEGYKITKKDVRRGDNLDIIDARVPPEQDIRMPDNQGGATQNAAGDRTPWTDANVIYFIPKGVFSKNETAAIARAFCEIETVSCVRFYPILHLPNDYTGNYVHFQRGRPGKCNSYVGMIGGRQDLNLEHMAKPGETGAKCFRSFGNVIHELLHAIGSWHEHTRSDREDYVHIATSAVINEPATYAIQYPPAQNYGSEDASNAPGYDVDSIMHYPEVAGKLTARNRTYARRMGQRKVISPKDIAKLRSWNKCDDKPARELSEYC